MKREKIFLFTRISRSMFFVLGLFVFLGTQIAHGADINGDINKAVVQPDGKVLIGGDFTTYNNTTINRIARINSDGTLDTTFGIGSGANSDVTDIELMGDGRIVLGGGFAQVNGTTNYYLSRLNSDGSIDSSFNIGTRINNWVLDSAVQSDGKIVIGGYFSNVDGQSRNYIARINANGTLDTSFATGTGFNNYVQTIAIQSDGKVIVGGSFTSYNGTGVNRIVRLNADGSLDTSFNVGTGANNRVLASHVLSNGQILIGGEFDAINGTTRYRVARLNSDGSLDTSFDSSNGPDGWSDAIWEIAVQTDGKILIGGDFWDYDGYYPENMARLNTDGSLDLTFDYVTGSNNEIKSISITNDKIVVAGSFAYFKNITMPSLAYVDETGSLYEPPNISGLSESLIPYEYNGGGTAQGWQDDDTAWTYTLPFNFNFYGTDYSDIKVSSHGYLCLDTSSACTSGIIDFYGGEPIIAPMTPERLRTDMGGGNIYITENANDVIIRWVALDMSSLNTMDFELVLSDSGEIQFNYEDGSLSSGAAVGITDGTSPLFSEYLGNEDFNQVDSVLWSSSAGSGSSGDSQAPVEINTEVKDTLTLDCYDTTQGTGNYDVTLGTTSNPGFVTAGTPAVGTSTCDATTNDDQGYYLSVVDDNAATNTVLTHNDPNTAAVYEIQDLTQYTESTPNTQNWNAPTTKGLGFSVISFPDTDTSNNTFDGVWTETGSCPEGNNPDSNDYAGIPDTPEAIAAVPEYSANLTTTNICYKVDVPASQPSGTYTGSVTYTATSDASSYLN